MKHFGPRGQVCYLPDQQSPELMIAPQMGQNMYMNEIFGICNGDQD